MAREIPSNAVQIQTGLYWELRSFVVGGVTHYGSRLYSTENYCFYDRTREYYDDDGNLITDEETLRTKRLYMQYCSTPETTAEALNARFVSIPIEEGFEIVSISKPTETI